MAPEDNIGNLKVPPRGCGTCQHALWATPAASGSPISMADHPCHRCSIGSSPVDWYPQYMPRAYQIEPQAPPVVPWEVYPVAVIEPDLVFGSPPTPEATAVEVGEPPEANVGRYEHADAVYLTADEVREFQKDMARGVSPMTSIWQLEYEKAPHKELDPAHINATEVREWMAERYEHADAVHLTADGVRLTADGARLSYLEYLKAHKKCEAVPPAEPALAQRNNAGKPALSVVLTFPEALRGVARAAAFGEKKDDRYNYLKGAPASQSVNSTLSHLLAWWSGEETDAESGLSHLDHFAWNALRLADELTRRPELDDRPDPLLMNREKGK